MIFINCCLSIEGVPTIGPLVIKREMTSHAPFPYLNLLENNFVLEVTCVKNIYTAKPKISPPPPFPLSLYYKHLHVTHEVRAERRACTLLNIWTTSVCELKSPTSRLLKIYVCLDIVINFGILASMSFHQMVSEFTVEQSLQFN